MPFEELDTERKDNMPPTALLSYLRAVRKGKEMDRAKIKPRLIVTLPTVFCTSKCEKFTISIGSGADHGKMMITGVKKGVPGKNAVTGKVFKTTLVMRFGYVPKFGDEIFDGVRCKVTKMDDDHYVLIVDEADIKSLPFEAPAVPLRKTA
jgi:hypothetical protein